MTKNEVKKLAKTAKRIINNEKVTTWGGVCFVEDTEVTYKIMHMLLMQCSRWAGSQHGNKILVSGTIASFTIEL